MRARLFLPGLLVAATLAAGCGGFQDPASNTNETFTGTVPVLGFAVTPFKVSRNGEYFITLNSLTPPLAGNLPTDIVLSAQTGGQCVSPSLELVNENRNSTPGRQVLSGTVAAGGFCLWVIDEGDMQVPTTFSITVNHS
jgi:hypothetical protein